MRSLFLAVEAVTVQTLAMERAIAALYSASILERPVLAKDVLQALVRMAQAQQRLNADLLSELTTSGDRPHGA